MWWIIVISIVIFIFYRFTKDHREHVETHITQFGGMKGKYELLITALEINGFKIQRMTKEIVELSSFSSHCTLAYVGTNLEVCLSENVPILGHTKKKWIFPDGYPQEKMIEEMRNHAIWQLNEISKYYDTIQNQGDTPLPTQDEKNQENINQGHTEDVDEEKDILANIPTEDKIQNKVIIIPFDDSDPQNIINFGESSQPDFIRIRVESKELVSNEGSLLTFQTRRHRFTIAKEVLEKYKLGIGSDFCKYFPECRISVREQVGEPFWKLEDRVQSPKMTPANEEKGTPAMVHLHEGLPIYRQTFFYVNAGSPNYDDVFVQTTEMITEEEFNAIYK